ncbi:UTP--glucose-1-phosphate uridylyltransferase GalU [Henriciella mobilis]|uniref:UTP--glucose-1-phosphate uridylyltransferase n=1 Tax=Henriciella mobilis TaxID=2305467 RepID=A0A399RAZ1_9PROT|nr:UTP--glucose-1-phosphate uridylyltransferase GalU [Henriciella mobilis]RIJ15138.1 UTP--glucose-1-phosphate uridylyltransferase [Henriciella mobilis]RIJ20266.1 UTP--glucose-1-phosphate uridylyltransferase [Henriciella mobilis]RIJ27085.1 UTP--glucose-1-phosphate uridylyltransferase [Henriciella mobilis]
MGIRKAVLPVAGHGTRVLPATKSIPKELLPVVDRPALQYVVDEALEAGIEHIVFVTGRGKGAIEDYFDEAFELETSLAAKASKADILKEVQKTKLPAGAASFTRQQAPLGLGHAVWCAKDIIGNEPFAVLLPDVIVRAKPSCLAQMVEAYNKVGGNIVAVDPVPEERVSSYGVIAPKSRDGRLIEMSGMVEKPPREEAPSNLKITGRYILQPEIFALLEDQGKGAGGEIQLTDSMERLMEKQAFYAFEFEGEEFDCGSKAGYFEAVLAHAIENPETSKDARDIIARYASRL